MITQPLTSTEEEILRKLKNQIQGMCLEFDETITIVDTDGHTIFSIDNEDKKETVLNILKLAERANEIITEQWRKKFDSKVNF